MVDLNPFHHSESWFQAKEKVKYVCRQIKEKRGLVVPEAEMERLSHCVDWFKNEFDPEFDLGKVEELFRERNKPMDEELRNQIQDARKLKDEAERFKDLDKGEYSKKELDTFWIRYEQLQETAVEDMRKRIKAMRDAD
ncbi:hypothetical protein BJ508DRAFT_330197 [Ascobolus immersus RN42]|uniref:Uncharacterized protein n=1 Tax=Ascobolus immersus RN42 TaxID=1160509 RepID=A0A3N4HUI1_ASCIM|nr:hypothetical protein BJ508DRAFT_330197 [Ascobolus immersus RN42]